MSARKIPSYSMKLKKQFSTTLNNLQSALAAAQTQRPQIRDEEKVVALPLNKIPFYKDYSMEKCDLRRRWVEVITGTKLDYVSKWWGKETDNPEMLKGNIELPIGSITIPLGVAGPLKINGEHASGDFIAPLSTTEGALIASINRGATALTKSGGVYACATQQRMTRAPVFKTGSPLEAMVLGEWVKQNKDFIQHEVVCKHSKHAILKDIIPVYDMETVHLLFSYETGDAAGQNATTVTTWNALRWINENAPVDKVTIKKSWIDGNLSGDKKSTNFNSVLGRGISVSVKATVPEHVLKDVLNTSSKSLLEFYQIITRIGERTNMMGCNANVANVLAAMFSACGQDMACVHESSLARVEFSKNDGEEGGIIASIYMPSLVIGTVGGGTNLPTQKECLEIMDCHGAGKVKKLAEIIAAYCLALDLSTISAVTAGEFVNAHDKLGRNRPEKKQ